MSANILTEASRQFLSRPSDERFASLVELDDFCHSQHIRSRQAVISSRKLRFRPTEDGKGLLVEGKNSDSCAFTTHWSFSQASQLAGVPASLLRTQCENGLAVLAADNLNAGLGVIRDIEDVGLLLRDDTPVQDTAFSALPPSKEITLAAATGPKYGRIWNADITSNLVKRFGDGVSADCDWRVPGIFGKELSQEEITKANTTFYASDRDMFVFLADERRRIELPNRREGKNGSLARGFFLWNSEVGSKSCGIAFFLFDYVCQNRIVWGVQEFERIAIRHTMSAPDRWMEEITPTLVSYQNASIRPIEAKLLGAQNKKLDNVSEFLQRRFTKKQSELIELSHEREEHKPIETLWDCVTGVTAFAKTLTNTDERVSIEREGGKILELAPSEFKTTSMSLSEAF